MSHELMEFLRAERGRRGVYAVCSAHPTVIEAGMCQALNDGTHMLLEATSNQVNHEGGYTRMRPSDFVHFVSGIAEKTGFPKGRLVLGGDHLGPNAWQHLPAGEAMPRAVATVRQYVEAGFTKIHLDASMRCADDPAVLSDEVVAARAAEMCVAAESSAQQAGLPGPVYVIGTEVPPPGGATHALDAIDVTSKDAVEETHRVHHQIFERRGLAAAWDRVIALVVQPGVEFDHDSVVQYCSENTRHLKPFLAEHPELVFEAHSSDYQLPPSYRSLIGDAFSILKVGPALTFALREALYALSALEAEIMPGAHPGLRQIMDALMMQDRGNWERYYKGAAEAQRLLRTYSYSDRIRYYWGRPEAQQAVLALFGRLHSTRLPETLLSQFFPAQYERVREGSLEPFAELLVRARVRDVLAPYAAACLG